MILNQNISGTPEEVKEALDLQERAWEAVVDLGREKIPWAKENLMDRHRTAFREFMHITDPSNKGEVFNFFFTLYSLNDAEGRIGDMLFHMAGYFVDKDTQQAPARGVIYGAKKCLEFVKKARKYDKAREGRS